MIFTNHEVDLPVPDVGFGINCYRAIVDTHPVLDLTRRRIATFARTIAFELMTQVCVEITTFMFVGPDMKEKGFNTDAEVVLLQKPTSDLLGAPFLS